MVILRVDFAEQRIGLHRGAADTAVAIACPDSIDSPVNFFLPFALRIVAEE